MTPTVIESSSAPDRRSRSTRYRIDGRPQGGPARLPHGRRRVLGHRGDRLGRRAGARRQELPPRARRPARTTSTTTAPKLHMIVLREKGATYWVVNSLLDNISNETMIAIAKGLRPLKAASKLRADGADRVLRRRLRRSRQRGLLRRARPRRSSIRDVVARADRGARRRAGPVLRARARGADRAQPRAAVLHARRWRRRSPAPSSCSSASARRRPRPATPNLSAVWSVIEELPADLERRRCS